MTAISRNKIVSQESAVDLTSTNSRLTTLENNVYKITYYEIVSGTSGSLTIPSQATINADEFGLSGNAILSKIDGFNKPTFQSPTTSTGIIVTTSLNTTTGAWAVSGAYTDAFVAVIYSISIKGLYLSNLTYSKIIESVDAGVAHLDSPALTGVPTAPTAVAGTNTIQIATTAFVLASSAAQTLQQVLTNGNSTGGLSIISPDTFGTLNVVNGTSNITTTNSGATVTSSLTVALSQVRLSFANTTSSITGSFNIGLFNSISSWNNATVTNSIVQSPAGIVFNSSVKIKSNAPIIEVSQDPTTALGIATRQFVLANVPSVAGTLNRITSTGGANPIIDISASYVGQSSLTTLGTIATGVWNGTALTDTFISSSTNWNTAYTNRITSLTVTGNSGSATLITNVLNIPTYTLAGLGGISLASLSAITPLIYNNSTGAFSIQVANTTQNGYLATADWNTFNNKQNALSGTGFVKSTAGVISYDTNTYLTANQTITVSGDVTGSGTTTIVTTLATVNTNVGSFGSASTSTAITVNAKGLITAISSTAIQIAESQVTNLVSDLALKAPITSPTFITNITTPQITGVSGTTGLTVVTNNTASGAIARGNNLTPTLIASANNDVLVGLDIQPTFTNGAFTGVTNLGARINGAMSVGNYATPGTQRMFTVGQDTAFVSIGSISGITSFSGIYFNQSAPNSANYSIGGTATATLINTQNSMGFQRGGGNVFGFQTSGVEIYFTPNAVSIGAYIGMSYTVAASTNQTLSTNIPNFKITGTNKHWATGAITNQYWNYLTDNSASFVGASTITNSYALFVEPATAGTNATITNNYALGLAGSLAITTLGSGLSIKEGTNAKMGLATLVAGTVTVANTTVTANSRIFLEVNGGTITNVGFQYISARTPGTSFTISSVNVLDASNVAWLIIEPL